jgi:hypothetical protein
MRLLPVILVCLLLPIAAAANAPHENLPSDPARFDAQRQAIESELNDGKKYTEITASQKREVLASLERIAQLLQRGPLEQLSENDRIALFNAQEKVNTVLTRVAEDSRVVCTRETPVGSHRSVNTCRTVAERRLAREQSQRYLERQRPESLPRGN